MTVRDALIKHFIRYRKMTPADSVKLCYQSEFGGGHLIKDAAVAKRRIEDERYGTQRDAGIPMTESVGDGICRLNFASIPEALSSETICRMFIQSAAAVHGNEARFERKLNEITSLISEKYAPFTAFDYMKYIERYFADGAGAVHHSFQYNSAYHPAYRVILQSYAPYIGLFTEIDRRLAASVCAPFLIRIDGRCGSGKSTLAKMLNEIYGCGTAHTDDFYIPYELRTEGCGSVDYGRLSRELSLLPSHDAEYGVYSCSEGRITGTQKVAATPFCILEGSFSMNSEIKLPCDLSVFLTIPPEVQLERISKRCPEKLDDFKEKWIPAEEEYFKNNSVPEKCDFIIDTSEE